MTSPRWIPAGDGPAITGSRALAPRLVLPRELVPVTLVLLDRPDRPPAGLDRELQALERAGITAGYTLRPAARATLAPLSCPTTVVSIEAGELERTISTVWISPKGTTLGWSPDQTTFELTNIDAPLLPFCIASLVELRVRPLRRRRPISLSSTRSAATSLAAELLRSGRRWRLTSTAAAGDGSTTEHLVEVIDAGPDGYWEITRDTGEGGLVLTARSTDSVLRMIGDVTVRP